MKMKKILAVVLSFAMAFSVVGCGNASKEAENGEVKLNLAFQYGLAYAPLTIAKDKGFIEKNYKEATGKEITINWNQMSSGADINTGLLSGDIDAGFMGVAPAITGVTKGAGYKIFTGLSGQEHGLMCNDDSINSLGDIVGSGKQIALVNIGSIQHIILAKSLVENGYDAHALDQNLVAMKHPDGKTALETNGVALHLTTNPYIYKEREDAALHELPEIANAWSKNDSFIVGVAAQTLHDNQPEVYEALRAGIAEAVEFINTNPQEAAAITAEFDGNTVEDELKYMQLGLYSTKTQGVYDLSVFMSENGFLDSKPENYGELAFEGVEGN